MGFSQRSPGVPDPGPWGLEFRRVPALSRIPGRSASGGGTKNERSYLLTGPSPTPLIRVVILFNSYFNFIIGQASGPPEKLAKKSYTAVPQDRSWDTIIVVDAIARGLVIQGAKMLFLDNNEGLVEAAERFLEGTWSLSGCKVVVILAGRADLSVPDGVFGSLVSTLLETIRSADKNVITLLSAILPSTADTRGMVKAILGKNDLLNRKCSESVFLEFTKAGRGLLQPGGPCGECFDYLGNLNAVGLSRVKSAIEGKLICASLGQRYDELAHHGV